MNNLTISIFGNKILLEIINESKLFSEFKMKFYQDIESCIKDAKLNNHLIIFFVEKEDNNYKKILEKDLPIILITNKNFTKNLKSNKLVDRINRPFSVINLKKKIITLFSKYEFKKSSLIDLSGYIIDRNERKIKKNNLELKLTEKEINFLILFSKSKEPISKNFVLTSVWKYSSKSDTHTVETHIHRLRKKILEKFKDNDFIKNNEKGYYI